MSGFRKTVTVLRETAGTYTNGVWVAGTKSTLTTQASCQPVAIGRDMAVLPEGRHMSDFIKVYSDDRLNVTADGEGIQPDIVVHQGFGYEIVSLDENQSDVINHRKYIAAKIFKFTNDAAWIAGTLKRP